MEMARVILFTKKMEAMSLFYGEVLGLKQVTEEKGWKEFAAGGVTIALHSGPASPGKKGPKIVFYAKDVAAVRERLVELGRSSVRCGWGSSSVCAMGRIRMAIPSSYRTDRAVSG
jgi:catechol 2,3-dioxygenase-like lactoylglutathione lyase family enzyme